MDKVNNNANSTYYNKNHTFYIADITNQHILNTIFELEKPDIVIHGAAESFVNTSLLDPNLFITNNVLGTQNIINACVKSKIEKLIYISSDEIYGQLKSEDEKSWKEADLADPRNPYAASKYAGEVLVKSAYHSYGLEYNITRCSNNYGPRQFPEKLIPKAIKNILNNEKVPIYGEGKQIRDWTHVFDNCQAIIDIMQKGSPNEVYNISANQEFTNLEVINKICTIMDNRHDLISFIEDPRGSAHDFRYSVNCDKLKALGWKPEYKFNNSIAAVISWYLSNKWWFNGL